MPNFRRGQSGADACKRACISRKRREAPNPHYLPGAGERSSDIATPFHPSGDGSPGAPDGGGRGGGPPVHRRARHQQQGAWTSHKPYTLLTAFDHPHILIGKSEMVTNFMHQNMSNNRIQRDLTSRPKIEDRIPIEKNPIWQVSGRRILCLKLGATVKCTRGAPNLSVCSPTGTLLRRSPSARGLCS